MDARLPRDLDMHEQDPHWTTGFTVAIAHQGLIARGGFGEVHKVKRLKINF